MNISEANDLNTLLHYVLNLSDALGVTPSDDQARDAAERLADRANKALGAGLTSDTVVAAWPELLLDNGDQPARPTIVFADDDTVTVVEADAYLRANGIDPEKIRKEFGS